MAISRDELLTILLEAVPPQAPRQYDPDKKLTESGLDSLDVSNFLLLVEERYDLKILDEDFERINTLNDVVAYVNARLAA